LRLCAVSVDLDEIPNYFGIHGLPVPVGPHSTLVYDVALDRLTKFAHELAIPLTLFAIGADLTRPAAAAKLRAASAAGFEIANHSLDHRYDLVRLGRKEMRRQVSEGARAIEQATGVSPVGFRAPGYTVTDELFEVLGELGVMYDSSVFPCPAYWAAKAAKIGLISMQGRESRSIVDTPNVLRAPSRPYLLGQPYWERGPHRGKGQVVELPVQVTPWLRLPVFGTSLVLWGDKGARRLARACVGEPLVNLELHGIDVLDSSDGLFSLTGHQPDVRIAAAQKLESLRTAVVELRDAGYAFVTLMTAAKAM
jgi:peptidoglycan-N-acetylglucosamine deacetylase